jgi:hypothetical protein
MIIHLLSRLLSSHFFWKKMDRRFYVEYRIEWINPSINQNAQSNRMDQPIKKSNDKARHCHPKKARENNPCLFNSFALVTSRQKHTSKFENQATRYKYHTKKFFASSQRSM